MRFPVIDRPNFILFMTDQQRWNHLSCNGNPVLKTPHIDSMAARGMSFDRFTVASAVCMPNRSTLMTGRMPSLHGVRFNGVPLDLGAVTLVDLLRAAGYRTGLVGKSHLQNFTGRGTDLPPSSEVGTPPPSALAEARRGTISGSEYEAELMPAEERAGYLNLQTPFYGFDHVDLCTLHGDKVLGHYDLWLKEQRRDADDLRGPANAYAEPDYSAPQLWHSRMPSELYPSSYIAEKSMEFLRQGVKEGEPFFLKCSFPDPHHPFSAPGDYFKKFDPDDVDLPDSFFAPSDVPTVSFVKEQSKADGFDKATVWPFAVTERELREITAVTYGMISLIDDCIGRVLACLDELGLRDNTVLLFTSDHGDFMGDHGIVLKGPLHYQGLVKVPFIWSDPADGHEGARTDALAGTLDIARTILARAGLAPFNGMGGHDLGPLMRGEVDRLHTGIVIEQDAQRPNFHFDGPIRARSYVTDRWRLSRYLGSEFAELYDLENDPQERENLWFDPAYAPVREELLSQMVMTMMENQENSPLPTGQA